MSKHKVVATVEEHCWLAKATKEEKNLIIDGIEEAVSAELHDWWGRKKNARKPFALIITIEEVSQ